MRGKKITKEALEYDLSWKGFVRSLWFLMGLGGKRKAYVSWYIFLFFIQEYSIVPPLIIGAIVNFFTNYKPGQSFGRFYFLSFLLGGTFIIISFIRLTIKNRLSLLSNITTYQIKVRGFENLLSQSLTDASKEATGEKVQKIQNGIDSYYIFFRIFNNQIMSAVASAIGIFAVMFYLRMAYALFFVAYIFLFFIIVKIFTQRTLRLNLERFQAVERASGVYVEGLSNIATLKSLGSEKHFQSRIVEREKVSKEYADKIITTLNLQWKFFQTLNGLSAGVFLFIVGKDVLNGILNVGEIVIFYSYFENMRTIADRFMDIYSDLLQAKSGIGRMAEVFRDNLASGASGQDPFPKKWERIRIIRGDFYYKPNAGIKNINLEINRGEKIGIVGKTGGGKSTLAKILLGLYPLKKGRFEIDGKNFYEISSEEVFRNMSVVPQDIEMFNMSLGENITIFREIDQDLFQKAIDISQLRDVIDALPRGLDTIVGEKGYRLSGGERQRLAIARAICRESQILVLDEATSSLDTKTEKALYDAFEKQFPDKTIIAIAHRIKTLENTDRIYVFDKGSIVEKGKFDELMKDENSHLFGLSQRLASKEKIAS